MGCKFSKKKSENPPKNLPTEECANASEHKSEEEGANASEDKSKEEGANASEDESKEEDRATFSDFLNIPNDSGVVDIQHNTIGSKITNVTFNVAPPSLKDEDTLNLKNDVILLSDKLRAAYKNITLPQVSWMDTGSLLLESYYVELTLDVNDGSKTLEDSPIPVEENLTFLEKSSISAGERSITQEESLLPRVQSLLTSLEESLISVGESSITQEEIWLLQKEYLMPLEESSISLEELFDGHNCPKRILVEGPPGYGKTTLAHKIVNDWALNREYTQRFKLAFLVKLRDLDQSIEKEFEEIAESCGYENKSNVDKIIGKFASTTLLVLDGFDELAPKSKLDILKILFRSRFDNITVVTTCRTGSYKLTEEDKKLLFKGTARRNDYYDKKVTINGLNYFDRKMLLDKLITGPDKEAITELIEKIVEPAARLFECPLFLVLLVFIVEDNPDIEVETQTDLYKNLIDCIIRRSCSRLERDLPDDFTIFGTDDSCREFRELFCEFGKISAECLKKESLHFECNNITDKIYELGFLIKGETKYKFKTRYHYEGFHLTILEFAAAYSMWVDYKINGSFFKKEEIINMVEMYARGDAYSLVFPFFGGLLDDEITTFFESYSLYSVIFSISRRTIFDILAECSFRVNLSSAVVPFLPLGIMYSNLLLFNTHVLEALVCFMKVKFKNVSFSELEVLPLKIKMENLVFLVDEGTDFVCQDLSIVNNWRCNIFKLSFGYRLGGPSSKEIEEWLKIFKSVTAETKKLSVQGRFNSIINDLVAEGILNTIPIQALSCCIINQPLDDFFITHIVDNNQLRRLKVDVFDSFACLENILSAVSISSYLETLELESYVKTFIDISVLTNNGSKKWKRVKLTAMTVDCTSPLFNPKCITEFVNTSCSNSPEVFTRVIPESLHCDYKYIIDAYHKTSFEDGWDKLKELNLNVTAYVRLDELVPNLSKLYSVNSLMMIKLHVDIFWNYDCENVIVNCLKSVNIHTILFDCYASASNVKFSSCLDVIMRENFKIHILGFINCDYSDELLPVIPAILRCLDFGNVNVVVLSILHGKMFDVVTHSSLDYSKYNIQHTKMKNVQKDLSEFGVVEDCICITLK